ncbi:MAG: serine/threonine protein kinase [Cyanobacteria bacterium J055]|nr:MAG: serine/threonine protein kinase [Cyanobacteria bacterium J055]
MSYCINPACPKPQNPDTIDRCLACGAPLLLHDRYRVVKVLGKGGFGTTFLAKNAVLPGNPVCTVKQLRLGSKDPQVIKRASTLFRREAATLGKIGNHPQVPSLIDYFETNNQFYLVQEYVQGLTLKQEVQKLGCFGETQVRSVLDEILLVLRYLQQQEVIHRDIKPANIIRRQIDRRLVLIDFGAVKAEVSQTVMLLDGGSQLPNTCFAIGTPGFAPREQIALQPVYASDIYALGATCLYLLTGESPRRLGCDPMTGEIIWRDRVTVSDRLAAILDKMLKPLVHYRYQSAEEVLEDLHRDPAVTPSFPTDATVAEITAGDLTADDDREPEVPAPRPRPAQVEVERSNYSVLAAQPRPISTVEKSEGMDSFYTGLSSATPSRSLVRNGKKAMAVDWQDTRVADTSQPSGKLTLSAFKSAYSEGIRDFADCDLSGLDLPKLDLAQINLYGSKLIRTNLKGSNLYKADLSSSGLNAANLQHANLSHAYLYYSNLSEADLRGADLSNAYLKYANLRGANLCGANLTNAKITPEQLALAKTNWRTILPNGKSSWL